MLQCTVRAVPARAVREVHLSQSQAQEGAECTERGGEVQAASLCTKARKVSREKKKKCSELVRR